MLTMDMLKDTLNMFAFLAIELTALFLVISYMVGILQAFITPEKIQSMLSSRNGKGYVIAALLGAITPFCSCSTIPFLKGLLRARAGFGPMMVFLFSSPLLNPVIIGLFIVTFGIQVAAFYFSIALLVSVSAGYTLEKLGFERFVREEAYLDDSNKRSCKAQSNEASTETNACSSAKTIMPQEKACRIQTSTITKSPESKPWLRIWLATWTDFRQVLPYLLLGITLGSVIYGFIPTDLIAQYAGDNYWYAIPIAAVIGIPLYIRAEAVIPLSAALVKKGMALGSVMALIIGSAGASLTEVILLKAIFKTQMIAAFLAVILGMAIAAGYLYSIIFI